MSAEWRKSSFSSGNDGNCVEIAFMGGAVGIRDSKNPAAAMLALHPTGLSELVAGIKAGRLNR